MGWTNRSGCADKKVEGDDGMAERSFDPVEVSQEILDRFKKLPVATIWQHVNKDAGVPLPFMLLWHKEKLMMKRLACGILKFVK